MRLIRSARRPESCLLLGVAVLFSTTPAAARADGGAADAGRHVVLPAGTVIPSILSQPLSSKSNRPGDTFAATVERGPDDAGLPEGTRVEGLVREALPAGDGKPGVLDVDFRRMVFPDGTSRTIDGTLYSLDGKAVTYRDGRLVAKATGPHDRMQWIGIGAGAGAVIGALTARRHAVDNVLKDTLLGTIVGGIAAAVDNRKPGDVNLKAGSAFGVRLDRQLAFDMDERSYYRRHNGNYDAPGRFEESGSAMADTRAGDAAVPIGVLVDDRDLRFDRRARPYSHGDVIYVAIEPVSRAIGLDYRYDPGEKAILARNGSVRLALGSRIAVINGERRRLPDPAEVHDGIVFVPMEFVGLASGDSVSYDVPSRTVVVTTRRGLER